MRISALIVARLILLLLAFAVARAFFFGINFSLYQEIPGKEIWMAFAWGERFDLSLILMVNLIFIVSASFVLSYRIHHPLLWRLFDKFWLTCNLIFLWIELADAGYFKLSGRRATFGIFQLAQDIGDQIGQLVLNYWYIPLFGVTLSLFLNWGWNLSLFILARFSLVSPKREKIWVLLWIGISVLGIRGGIQSKPLHLSHAFRFDRTELGSLALNTSFSITHTYNEQSLPQLHFFPSNQEALQALGFGTPIPSKFPYRKQNVVILIIESLGTEYTGIPNQRSGYLPFIDELSKKSLYFENNYANGRRSIEAVTSIIGSIPSLMDEPFITSAYQGNRIAALPNFLASQGYRTLFFHGGRNGTMYFDSLTRLLGVHEYVGLNEYTGSTQDHDGTWGIFDEPFLQFSLHNLSQGAKPFFATIFTLSSHNPYKIPAAFNGKFPKGTLAIHESLGYADYALQQFFTRASQEPWYHETLFIITGDHTSYTDDQQYQKSTDGLYRVPLLFFHPGGLLPPEHSLKVTQHTDISPSILDFLGYTRGQNGVPTLPFGHSVFNQQFPGAAIGALNGEYWLISGARMLLRNTNGQETFVGNSLQHTDTKQGFSDTEMQLRLKASMQYFNNGLVSNSW